MRIFENANFNFMASKKIGYIVSGVISLIAIGGILVKGIQFGIDFKGGKEFVVEFVQPVGVTAVRDALSPVLGSQPEVKFFGTSRDLLIRVDSDMELNALQTAIIGSLNSTFEGNSATIIKTDIVGPRFAEDLKLGALNAVIFSMVLIFLYVLMRFRNWTFSAGAVIALVHDVLVTLGLFTILNKVLPFSMEIDQNMIAAFLTIVGYSLNDTVVIFDRIRENRMVHKNEDLSTLVNRSINSTLSRTIITSGTTLFVVAVLFLFGGEVLKGLSFALLIGIIVGTYSTIFVASSLYVDLSNKYSRS